MSPRYTAGLPEVAEELGEAYGVSYITVYRAAVKLGIGEPGTKKRLSPEEVEQLAGYFAKRKEQKEQ